ncbi:MAG: chemotaxis protein CheW, partial [Gammaproteobacteria bacterium]
MTDDKADNLDALLTLLDLAHADIADALGQDGAVGSDEFRQSCSGHLENILWACTQAGQSNLYLATDALLAHLGDDAVVIEPDYAAQLLSWCGDARIYAEAPDPGSAALLLGPLPQDAQESLLPLLQDDGEATPEAAAEAQAEDSAESAPAAWPEAEATGTPPSDLPDDQAAVDQMLPEIAEDDLLGMLALELKQVEPQLGELARQLAAAEADTVSAQLVEAYLEILGRVESIANELDLQGLAFVCGFLNNNVNLIANQSGDERLTSAELLRGWPAVVIEHLLHPEDDNRCLAIVDYLEAEAWPEPVPYRDQRTLIEGLARSIEVSSEFVGESREIEAMAEDVSLEMSADTSPELIDAFFSESPRHAETLSGLMEVINQGIDVQQNVEAAQRIAHTLKGSGNLIGIKGIANLSHHLEDIFEYIARHKIQPPPPLAHTMQEASDLIEAMIEALQGLAPPPPEAQRVLQDVLDWANRIDSGQMRAADFGDDSQQGGIEAGQSEIKEQEPPQADQFVDEQVEQAAVPAADEVVRVPLRLLDNIFRIVSETAITAGQIQERLSRLEEGEKLVRGNDGQMQQLRYELENLVSVRSMAARHRGSATTADDGFDALEMDEYDEFYSATHAYIEAVADSRELLRGFTSEVYELDTLFLEQQRLNKELQQMVMTTRMVPVNVIVSRLQRTVRQVCRTTGKQAELSVHGQDLLLDGDVLNKLADPLMHMLRNAIDHGIEDSDARIAAGKLPSGQITLSFVQEGNNVVVNCSDDGRGLDYDRIRQTAIESGLIGHEDTPGDKALAKLILHPGFSTSTQVTQISGRGVGMDVVNNTIQSLNGTMRVGDGEDGGTLVSLRLPITLLTSHCLLAGVGKDKLYAIPTLSLTQILSPGTGFIENLGDRLSFQLDEETYSAYTLNTLIGAGDRHMHDHLDHYSVVLVQTTNGIIAVVVERVVTSYDLVVKNMGAYVKSISGIAGVSMLGNGEVVPVLDLAAILHVQDNLDPGSERINADWMVAEDIGLPKVLIVDDSLSVRNSLA